MLWLQGVKSAGNNVVKKGPDNNVRGGAGIAPSEAIPGQVSETGGITGQRQGEGGSEGDYISVSTRVDVRGPDAVKQSAAGGLKATAQDSDGSNGM